MKQYPKATDYAMVLQHPAQAFTVPQLQQADIAKEMGLPCPIPGSSAAVFRATIGGKDYALRCYTRDEASSQDRYVALDRFVAGNPALKTSVGTVKWYPDAVKALGTTWPVLQMEWIDGDVIGDYVGYLADNGERAELGALAEQWHSFVKGMQAVQFAHGDLQHRNVIIDEQQRFRLVDFDGVWCPPLSGKTPPTEGGHDNFQPPGRTSAVRWGAHMDTFSALVIYLALTALSHDTDIWGQLNDGENLLFTSKDFSQPFNTKVWDLLARLNDEKVSRLAKKLQDSCVPTGAGDKRLDQLVTPGWWEKEQLEKLPSQRPSAAPPRRPTFTPAGGTPWYTQPTPARPGGGYQSPVKPVPARPSQPSTSGGKWWETGAQAAGPPAAKQPYWTQNPGPRSGPSSSASSQQPNTVTVRQGSSGSSAPRYSSASPPVSAKPRTPAKKEYPNRVWGTLLFLAGIIMFVALMANHSGWAWAGTALVLWGLGLFFDKK